MVYRYAAILLTALIIMVLASTHYVEAQAKILIDVADPEGDDRGPGYYGYPTNPVFVPGVFDIVRFQVVDEGKALAFRIGFKNLGGNPWNGPNGFSLQNIQIYVRTTLTGLPARTDTIGLNVVFSPTWAWHFALIIAPGWGTPKKPVPEGEASAIYFYSSVVVQNGILNVSVDGNTIVARVNKSVLPDVEHLTSWTIVVMVTSYDGFGPNKVRPVGPTGGEWVVNGSKYATPDQLKKIAKAIAAGVEPRVLDIAVYSPDYKGIDAKTQYAWLDSFNPDLKLVAMIPPLPSTTVTQTFTWTTTTTRTFTQTITLTSTQILTQTLTSIQTVTTRITTTTPVTVTTTVVERAVMWDITIAIAIVLLLIGIAIGWFIRRR